MNETLAISSVFLLTFCATYGLEISGSGELPGGGGYSGLAAVSGDGKNFAGSSSSSLGFEGFHINASGELFGVGDLEGGSSRSEASGVSNTGIVVGSSSSANGNEACMWSESGMLVALGDLDGGGFFSAARDVSDDGSRIVGVGISNQGREAFLWREGLGMIGLGDLPGGRFESRAFGISPDGSHIVGESHSTLGHEAFIWSEQDGMSGIGTLQQPFGSRAYGVTNGGTAVVGESAGQAFHWTPETGMVGIGFLDQVFQNSSALGCSADGNIAIGWSLTSLGTRKEDGEETAFVWTPETGMLSLERVLDINGLQGHGWILIRATSISNDGTIIVGEGTNPVGIREGFIIRGIRLANIHLASPIRSTLSISGQSLAVSCIVRHSSPLLTYQLENSSDLKYWIDNGPSIKGDGETIQLHQNLKPSEAESQFFRLKVSVEN